MILELPPRHGKSIRVMEYLINHSEELMTNTEIAEAKKYFHRKLAKLEKDLVKADDHGDSGLVMTLRKKIAYYRTAMVALNNCELELWNRSK